MTENKRYFERRWAEEFYIFDSDTISESDFEEKLEYQDYKAFEDSMMGDEVVDRLNELNDTNQELYDFRLVLNALLFNEWAENGKYEVYKSKRHSDGELCFEGEWFVVVAILPTGQVTNHYHIKYWDYFKIPAYDIVKDEFDGHTSTDVLIRYGLMLK